MKCGNCGEARHILYAVPVASSDNKSRILAKCCGCNNASIIEPTTSTMQIKWTPNGTGVICTGWVEGE